VKREPVLIVMDDPIAPHLAEVRRILEREGHAVLHVPRDHGRMLTIDSLTHMTDSLRGMRPSLEKLSLALEELPLVKHYREEARAEGRRRRMMIAIIAAMGRP
jgi:D-Tyr-tRNAtyr deacylase